MSGGDTPVRQSVRRRQRTQGNHKPAKVDEEKLAFIREAYEHDEEHLVAEALFDLANMFGEEEDEGEEEGAHSRHNPPLNGKRMRRGTAASTALPSHMQSQQQQPKMARSYSQQRAMPLPRNAQANGNGTQQYPMAPPGMQHTALLQQQLQHHHQQQQQQQHPYPSAGQAAQGSTHPPMHPSFPHQYPFPTAGLGLPAGGSNPFFMPPPPYPHMQLPPGALSGKLATTLLPNGSPVSLAFGPNGTLMPLPGGWPHNLLHPQQQRQQQQQHPIAMAQQQLQQGLAGLQAPYMNGGSVLGAASLGLPVGALHAGLASQQHHQGGGFKQEGAAAGGQQQQPGSNQQQHLGKAPSNQQQPQGDAATNGPVNGVQDALGKKGALKRCALHVRIAHMIMERQQQQQQQQQQQDAPQDSQQPKQEPQPSVNAPSTQQPTTQPTTSTPPSPEHGSLVRQHSAGSTSTCPSAPSALADTNTSPASTRVAPPQTTTPVLSQPPKAAAPESSPPKQEPTGSAGTAAPPAGPSNVPSPQQQQGQGIFSAAALQPSPQPQQASNPPATTAAFQQQQQQQHQQQLLFQQQQLLQLQRLQQLQAMGVNVSAPFNPFPQGLPGINNMSQPSPLTSLTPGAAPSSYGFPAIYNQLAQGLQQPHVFQPPIQQQQPQQQPQQGAALNGVPPHLLQMMMGQGMLTGMPGLMPNLHSQPVNTPAVPGIPLNAQALLSQQQQQQQRPGAAAAAATANKAPTREGPPVH